MEREIEMKQTQALKILIVISLVLIVLTESISVDETPMPLKVGDTSVNVLSANLVWSKVYGDAKDDRAYDAVTAGNGYLVVGSSESMVPNTTVGLVLRLDEDGNAVWNVTFLEGQGTEIRCAINLTDGFLLVGNEFLPSGGFNGFVAKINLQGTLLWNNTIGDNQTDEFYSAIATSDGFLLLGLASSTGGTAPAAWVVKIDQNGNVIWNKTYSFATDTVAKTGSLAPDGDYMVAGFTDPRGPNNYSFLLMKIDPDGNLVWNQTYGTTGSQEAHAMTQAPDGYVIVGDTQKTGTDIHAWVVKVDFKGTLQWAETVGGNNADSPSCITPAQGGGYLIGGFTFSWGAGNRDFWLFKIDESGKILWSCTQGNAGYQEAYAVIQTDQNHYVMVGWTDPPGQPALIGKAKYDFYVVKLSPQTGNKVSVLQVAVYVLTAVCILAVAWLLVLKIRSPHRKDNQNNSAEQTQSNFVTGIQLLN